VPAKVEKLVDLERASCFDKKKHHNMLADMVALSMTDFHLGNPLSSCDDIVATWRKHKGKGVGSSYPQGCYDGIYANDYV
jgi:hypothetical protein